ncbi:MAG: glycosyltransferase family 4 protein, partial [Candidatus Magasanikbacteria bacterium]
FSLLSVTKKYKIPTVMTLHDYKMIHPNYTMFHHGKVDNTIYTNAYFRCVLNNCMESLPRSFAAMLEGWFRKKMGYDKSITIFLAPSRFMQEKMKEAGYTNVELVPNPVFRGNEVYTHTEGKNIVYVGRFSQEKGVDMLLRVAEKTPELPYVFIGDGSLREELEIYITLKKIKNVRITGWLGIEKIQKELKDARLVVVPSVWYENNPLSILEAVQNGKLVLGADIGGIPELLSPDLLFRPGNKEDMQDAIEKWYTADEDVRKKKEQELFQELSTVYSFEEYRKRLEKVYGDIHG